MKVNKRTGSYIHKVKEVNHGYVVHEWIKQHNEEEQKQESENALEK